MLLLLPLTVTATASLSFFHRHFHFPAVRLVRGVTLSDLVVDKTWSQVSSPLPPGARLHFYRA